MHPTMNNNSISVVTLSHTNSGKNYM